MMKEESLQPVSPAILPDHQLPLSDDSLVVGEETSVDSPSSGGKNNDLTAYPETVEVGLVNVFPESESPFPEAEEAAASLTPEIFASGAIPSGTRLGHFVIKNFIGGGGMGRVYLATDTALDRNVAIKVLPRQRANDQSTVARFMNEAKSAARLNHEHIAQVYFAGEQAGIPFIVFEYVEGTNVRTMVGDFDSFPLPQALNYLIQVSHALAHAAEHGVVHRDVKPSNILITKEGRAKLIDMGLARLLDPSESKDDLTASGVTLGTFDYISPEQARDPRNADIRSDIYSLGCTFFFMLSGRPPFPEGTVLQKLLQHQGDEPPDIRAFQPNIPAEVALLIQKMMAKDPRQRFQNPAVLIESLVNVAKMIGLQPTGPGKLIWVMTPQSKASYFLKHVPWLAAVIFLTITVFFMSLYSDQLGKLEPPMLPEEPDVVITQTVQQEVTSLSPKMATAEERRTTVRENKPVYSVVSYSPSTMPKKPMNHPVFAIMNLDKSGKLEGGIRPEFLPLTGQAGLLKNQSGIIGSACVLDIRKTANFTTNSVANSQEKPFVETEKNILPKRRCVDPSGETPGAALSLALAIADADKQTTIELKWNGVMLVDSLFFAGQQLKLVAAEGYSPILLFDPSESMNISQNSRNMFTVASSELEFSGLAMEMRIQQGVLAQDWSLFELVGGNKLTFSRCCLTIRNKAKSDNSAYHDDVAFFRNGGTSQVGINATAFNSMTETPSSFASVSSASSAGNYSSGSSGIVSGSSPGQSPNQSSVSVTESIPAATVTEQLKIFVTDSLIRGEATVLQCDVPQSIDCKVQNSFIALAKPFIQTEDTKRTNPQAAVISLRLDHLTFWGRAPFVRQSRSSFGTEPMKLEIGAGNSIFILNNFPFAVFRGAPTMKSAFDYFKWSGESNYFQNVSLGWKFIPSSSALNVGTTDEMSIADWKEKLNPLNEKDARLATRIDVLKFDEIRKPTHRLLPQDLKPEFLPESQAAEEDRGSAGCPLETLDWIPRSWMKEEKMDREQGEGTGFP